MHEKSLSLSSRIMIVSLVVLAASQAPIVAQLSEPRDASRAAFVRSETLELISAIDSLRGRLRPGGAIERQLAAARRQLERMTDVELGALPLEATAALVQLNDLLPQLEEVIDRRQQPQPQPVVPLTSGFPNAVYPDVDLSFGLGQDDSDWAAVCSGPDRSDGEDFFIAFNVYQTAKVLRDILGRGCNQVAVVVVLGEGGGANTSAACIISDVIFNVAEAVFNAIALCDGLIDAAEIEGSYERLAHVHDDVEAARSEIITAIEESGDLMIRLKIEENLLLTDPDTQLSTFQLPGSVGGLLEMVQSIVTDTIQMTLAAGESVGTAPVYLTSANAFLANQEYKKAYKYYRLAYQRAVRM